MKQRIYEKGITLIVLVIIIIVLLILVGVAISILFNNGIAKNTQTAADKYSEEVAKYTVTISKGAGIENVTKKQQVEAGKIVTISAVTSSGYEFSKWNVKSGNERDVENLTSATTKVTVNGNMEIEAIAERTTVNPLNPSKTLLTGENTTINGKDFAYTNPVIPVGFKTVETKGASWKDTNNDGIIDGWNDGLVIEDEDGNQFVWVPVDGTNVTYGYHYNVHSSGSESAERNLPSGITNEQEQINTYHGFYIARYEAGIPSTLPSALTTASVSARNVAGTPVCKKNEIPWNYISWSQAKTNAESMKTFANSSNHVQSILITDKMWETTLQWLENSGVNVKTDCRSWGNYYDASVTGITQYSINSEANWTSTSSTTKGTSTGWLLKTGHSEYTNRKNIYDLAGNLWEWTNAKYSSSSSYYTLRGGGYYYYGTTSVAVNRNNYSDAGDSDARFQSWFICSVKFCEHVSASKIS